jgi:hypothetical protein
MNMLDLAEAGVVRKGFSPHWGRTTTTTIEDEQLDISTTSEVAPQHLMLRNLFIAWMAQAMSRAVPPSIGKVLLFEGAPEQVGLFEDAIGSSGVVTHFFNAPAWGSVAVGGYRSKGVASPFYADELLDWDFAVEAGPKRPTRTLRVMLKYVPRGSSAPFENPGD